MSFALRRLIAPGILVSSLASLWACGGTTEVGGGVPKKDTTPASLAAVSTDTIRGAVGTQGSLPINVIVKNAAGDPLDTTLVTFAIASGGGTLGNLSVRTNASGQAQTTWTLGNAVGLQTATATVGALAPVTFRAVATAGAAATLTKVAGDAQSAAIGSNVAVAPSIKLTDRFGNPVAGQQVTFSVGTGAGLVNGGVVNSGADGSATVTSWRLGSIGPNTLIATAGTLTATFTATATVGAAASITLAPLTLGELLVGDVSQLTPRVVDAGGNVLTNPTVTYTSSDPNVVAIAPSGAVTAVGAGNATITASSGTAISAAVPVTVIGHPAGLTISSTISFNFVAPGDVAFTNNAMLIGLGGLNQIMVRDITGATQTGLITVNTFAQTIVAPTKAAGPAILVAPAFPSRLFFIDPAVPAVVDSLSIAEIITSSAMKADGTRYYASLSNGEVVVVDAVGRREITRIALGGGVQKIRMAPGDTTLYALTNVGVVFDIDLRSNTVRRQIIANPSNTDFAIGRDGNFYLLDGTNALVRVFDINTSTVIRTIGVAPGPATIALSPDGKQIWLTHTQGSITIYQGSVATGFLSAGTISTNLSPPIRAFFSPSGSFAAVTNLGGWVDIIR